MIILDTSFLVAFHNASDVHHERAAGLMERIVAGEWGDVLLLEYVFLETTTVLALRRDLPTAVRVGGHLLSSREVRFSGASDHSAAAWDVFRSQERAALSFVDAAIVAVARAVGSPFVATFDRGFRGVPGVEVVPV